MHMEVQGRAPVPAHPPLLVPMLQRGDAMNGRSASRKGPAGSAAARDVSAWLRRCEASCAGPSLTQERRNAVPTLERRDEERDGHR